MEETPVNRAEYIQKILDAYRQTPGTTGMIRRPDRLLAEQLMGAGCPCAPLKTLLCWRRRAGKSAPLVLPHLTPSVRSPTSRQ
jgi:hypothetical protein